MGYEFAPAATRLAAVTTLVTLSAIAVAGLSAAATAQRKPNWPRLLLCSWMLGLCFIIWKYGVVREGEFQLCVLVGFMPVLAFASLVLTDRYTLRRIAAALATACMLSAFLLLDAASYRGSAAFSLSQPLRLLAWNAKCLSNPVEYLSAATDPPSLPKICSHVGNRTIDVFGAEQSCALLNGLNYTPRPVFQSLAAYTAPLMLLNERFYLSSRAPEFVMFVLNAIDKRFPPLEDAMILRDLLINYQLVESEDHFLLLEERSAEIPKLSLVRESAVRVGDQIPIVVDGSPNLWMQIEMQPTLSGKLRRLLYKPAPICLWVRQHSAPDQPEKFWAPGPMLSAGFLISPLVLNNTDVQNLYAGAVVRHATSVSIELPPEAKRFWQPKFQYRLYRIENQLGQRSVLNTVEPGRAGHRR